MRRFRFRLERLLQVRRVRERVGQARLAVATRQELDEKNRLVWLDGRLHLAGARLEAGLQDRPAAWEMGFRLAAIHRLGRDLVDQEGRLDRARQKTRARRGELVGLWRGREVLERLRRRRVEQHRQEWFKEEQGFLDEVGAGRSTGGGQRGVKGHGRGTGGGGGGAGRPAPEGDGP